MDKQKEKGEKGERKGKREGGRRTWVLEWQLNDI